MRAFLTMVHRVSPVLGAFELTGGILRLLDHAWLTGTMYVGVGLFLLLSRSPWLARRRLAAKPRPVSEAQRRRSAWILSHPVEVALVFGAVFTASIGGLAASRLGHWPLAMAVCTPGGLVFGWMMVREMHRMAP